jgi:hypothetical protein
VVSSTKGEDKAPALQPRAEEAARALPPSPTSAAAPHGAAERALKAAPARPPRVPGGAKGPPNEELFDLADHLRYLERWCTALAPCARQLMTDKRRVPVMGVQELSRLSRDAEACVARCRR